MVAVHDLHKNPFDYLPILLKNICGCVVLDGAITNLANGRAILLNNVLIQWLGWRNWFVRVWAIKWGEICAIAQSNTNRQHFGWLAYDGNCIRWPKKKRSDRVGYSPGKSCGCCIIGPIHLSAVAEYHFLDDHNWRLERQWSNNCDSYSQHIIAQKGMILQKKIRANCWIIWLGSTLKCNWATINEICIPLRTRICSTELAHCTSKSKWLGNVECRWSSWAATAAARTTTTRTNWLGRRSRGRTRIWCRPRPATRRHGSTMHIGHIPVVSGDCLPATTDSWRIWWWPSKWVRPPRHQD